MDKLRLITNSLPTTVMMTCVNDLPIMKYSKAFYDGEIKSYGYAKSMLIIPLRVIVRCSVMALFILIIFMLLNRKFNSEKHLKSFSLIMIILLIYTLCTSLMYKKMCENDQISNDN